MKKEDFAHRLREETSPVQVSFQLRRRTLDAAQGKDGQRMKKRTWILVAAMMTAFMCAAAFAAANRAGMLDFMDMYAGYIPENAQAYVEKDVLTMENQQMFVCVREMYYDGRAARMTVDITPKAENVLLLGPDTQLDDNWQNLALSLDGHWDEDDRRTVMDVFREKGYERAYVANIHVQGDEEESTGAYSMNWTLGEDGTLTMFQEHNYLENVAERKVMLQVSLIPLETPVSIDSQMMPEEKSVIEGEIVWTAAEDPEETDTFVSAEPVEFENAGVRIDRLLIEVKPQEIFATVDYTITDQAVYSSLEDGLMFEFVEPEREGAKAWEQRLNMGLSTGGTYELATGQYRQMVSLARNELHEAYTLRAFECWEKERFEEHTIAVYPVPEKEQEAGE